MDYNITTFTTEKVDALMKRCLLNENQFTALKDIKHFLSWEQSKPSAAAEAAAPMVTAPDAKAAEAAEVSPLAAQAAPEGNEQKNECSVM